MRWFVESTNPPPNHDIRAVTEHSDKADAIELAREVHGRVWEESADTPNIRKRIWPEDAA